MAKFSNDNEGLAIPDSGIVNGSSLNVNARPIILGTSVATSAHNSLGNRMGSYTIRAKSWVWHAGPAMNFSPVLCNTSTSAPVVLSPSLSKYVAGSAPISDKSSNELINVVDNTQKSLAYANQSVIHTLHSQIKSTELVLPRAQNADACSLVPIGKPIVIQTHKLYQGSLLLENVPDNNIDCSELSEFVSKVWDQNYIIHGKEIILYTGMAPEPINDEFILDSTMWKPIEESDEDLLDDPPSLKEKAKGYGKETYPLMIRPLAQIPHYPRRSLRQKLKQDNRPILEKASARKANPTPTTLGSDAGSFTARPQSLAPADSGTDRLNGRMMNSL